MKQLFGKKASFDMPKRRASLLEAELTGTHNDLLDLFATVTVLRSTMISSSESSRIEPELTILRQCLVLLPGSVFHSAPHTPGRSSASFQGTTPTYDIKISLPQNQLMLHLTKNRGRLTSLALIMIMSPSLEPHRGTAWLNSTEP